MSSNVVFNICQALAQRGVAALRFNFRGVSNSGGTFGDGIAEQEDVRAALALVSATPDIDPTRIGLAGYSFGGGVALAVAAQETKVSLLALVSPALFDSGREQLKAYPRPVFLISGECDCMIPPELVRQYAKNIAQLERCELISGADHFWQGYEAEVAEKVAEFFASGFKGKF
jgi:alpha/beta superfamily hydrolase